MHTDKFIRALQAMHFKNAFNPYVDTCTRHDKAGACKTRTSMLRKMLRVAAKKDIDSLWLGCAPGYRGGRRTGLALTDDMHIAAHLERWDLPSARPTKGEACNENTASTVWPLLKKIEDTVFLWNVFPLHPYKPGNPFSNRPHNGAECRAGELLLSGLIDILNPRRIVAIGNDAHQAACKLYEKEKVCKVRHPSYGGKSLFISQIRQLYRLS